MDTLTRLKETATGVWKREPVRITGIVTSGAVFALAKFGIVLPKADIAQAVGVVVPVLLGFGAARSRVTPAK